MVLLFLQTGCGGNYQQAVEGWGGKTVIRVDLSNTEVTDDDLVAIDFPDTLREISLANTGITDEGVQTLSQYENLDLLISTTPRSQINRSIYSNSSPTSARRMSPQIL